MRIRHLRLGILILLLASQSTMAGPLLDRLIERRQQRQGAEAMSGPRSKIDIPKQSISYGSDANQTFDVYAPKQTTGAPVIFMVHGGGWKRGDKNAAGVVDNKVKRWVNQGIVFISVNYRMLPDADPYVQAEDIARALAKAQQDAARWGADRNRFVLMGHSAGAHLVSLLAASPGLLQKFGASAPIGTVSLDSATLDVVQTMEGKHFRLHDDAFGTNPAFWEKVSPWHAMSSRPAPILAVCSTRRADACPQAVRFTDKAKSFGGVGIVLRQDMTHGEINAKLGDDETYTQNVENFLSDLDPELAQRLSRK